ncbi:haloacid dehalogenase type II [candidate division KSB1 bacterium]
MLDFSSFEVLTFDCYGTLIDWETGIIEALKPVFVRHHIKVSDKEILELYAEMEAMAETREYVTYRKVLKAVMENISQHFGMSMVVTAFDVLAESIRSWEPFPDTVEALTALKKRYRLGILSNIDDDLFKYSSKKLRVPFDWIITAEQAQSYKPSLNNFFYMLQKIDIPQERILHVAQSVHHDIVPAQKIGLKTVWVNRSGPRKRFGATLPAHGKPDLEVPDLKTLTALMGLS